MCPNKRRERGYLFLPFFVYGIEEQSAVSRWLDFCRAASSCRAQDLAGLIRLPIGKDIVTDFILGLVHKMTTMSQVGLFFEYSQEAGQVYHQDTLHTSINCQHAKSQRPPWQGWGGRRRRQPRRQIQHAKQATTSKGKCQACRRAEQRNQLGGLSLFRVLPPRGAPESARRRPSSLKHS